MAAIGTTSNLVAGVMLLKMPVKVNFWFVQNQSAAPLVVTFLQGSSFGYATSLILTAALADGSPGGYLDSIGFPYFDDIVLTSVEPTAQFGSGAFVRPPVNNYPYPLPGS